VSSFHSKRHTIYPIILFNFLSNRATFETCQKLVRIFYLFALSQNPKLRGPIVVHPRRYPLIPSNATRSKCTNNNAGKIKLEIKFRDEDHPGGIVPEEIEPQIPDVDVIEGAQVVSSGPVVEATVVNAHAQVGSGDVLAAEVQPF